MGKKKKKSGNGTGNDDGFFQCAPTDANGTPIDVERETLEEMRQRHAREIQSVREYCQTKFFQSGMKQAKTKAMIEEGKVTDRHLEEENALERRVFGTPDASSSEGEEEEEEDKSKTDKEEASEERKQQGGPTKAQKRREKKAAEEKARELAIEMERARLRESGPSKKEIEDEAMRRALKALDLDLTKWEPVVTEQVDEMKEESRYGEVRTMCKDEMLKNREEYEAFVEMEEAGSYEKYCEKVGSTAEWGGHVEMLAIARALRRNVEVFEVRPGGEVEKMVVECVGSGVEGEEGKGGSSFPLRVAFMKESYTLGEHYDAVVSL